MMDLPIPVQDMLAIRQMQRSAAASFLHHEHPGLDADAIEKLLNLAKPDTAPKVESTVRIQVYDPARRQFMLAAYLAGASFNQLGHLYQVTRQTVQQSVDRLMLSENRQQKRITGQHLTYERVGRMRELFNSRRTEVPEDPLEAARKLLEWTADWTDE